MERFNDTQREVIKRYIIRNEKLFEDLSTSRLVGEFNDALGLDCSIEAQSRKELFEEWIVNNETIVRIYVLMNYENRLHELFESPNAHETLYFSRLEFQLIYDYQRQMYEENFVENPQYAMEEYGWLYNRAELYKLFENDAYTNFLMPRKNEI
ncbi:hypothetical protein GCM10011344_06990 [Dokdonia pacifica]|uniref:Uncharacterized protein n=1 Tax=Dokdonia pacifica TaxID=1627892 RepID=A0A238Z066_9FLAO|nr:hypothetical protein [Dokdonia pacifica]GGG08996.1 hypothetical protein GCM10011344_06990 [Dokdonia pacifica]SNR76747.1 hypothetical protein SAMN06265376_102504 [Dokdonia pacifica]